MTESEEWLFEREKEMKGKRVKLQKTKRRRQNNGDFKERVRNIE